MQKSTKQMETNEFDVEFCQFMVQFTTLFKFIHYLLPMPAPIECRRVKRYNEHKDIFSSRLVDGV